jgi:D-sedoheptulose 7-phosphate isomerase
MKRRISNIIKSAIDNFEDLLSDEVLQENLYKTVDSCIKSFKKGNKMLLCGNGGSAADAQHIASELSGQFYHKRDPLHAEALHVNSSYMTAVANDYGYENTYQRIVQASGKEGDVLIGISTSGNSKNVIKAFIEAKKIGMVCVGFTGEGGGEMNNICDILLKVPSIDIARIQEAHILIGHTICQLIEEEMFSK